MIAPIGNLQRPSFRLTEQVPIHATVHVHDRPGELPLFDMHYELELGVVLSGRMRRYYSGVQMDCVAGDAWCCGMWEPHGYEVIEAPCRVLVLVVWPPLIANMHYPEVPHLAWMAPFTGPPGQRAGKLPPQRGMLLALAERMAEVADCADPARLLRLRLLLVEMLLALHPQPAQPGDAMLAWRELYPRVVPALELVFESRALVTNAQAARCCAMSVDQFTRAFQSLMGISFARFALRHRIRGAADELACSDQPLKAVARHWGFSDESHLHRLFVKHYGCPPAAYRRRRQCGLPVV